MILMAELQLYTTLEFAYHTQTRHYNYGGGDHGFNILKSLSPRKHVCVILVYVLSIHLNVMLNNIF